MERFMETEHRVLTLVACAAASFVLYKIVDIAYVVFFGPLRAIPGPWWTAASRLPYAWHLLRGTAHTYLQSLHVKYGPVVRYSPNEVSFTKGDQVWQQIYGFRTGKQRGTQSFAKDAVWYTPGIDNVHSILTAPEGEHGRQRRIISHAFSERSLRDQEWLLQRHTNTLISRIKETDVADGDDCDLNHWITLLTFDIISDLTFGSGGFGGLSSDASHSYVKGLLDAFKTFAVFYCMRYWPILIFIQRVFLGEPKVVKNRNRWVGYLREKVMARIEAETAGHDFMTDILNKISDEESKGNEGITKAEILSNANIFMGAGTETTATVLQCATYLMLQHPEIYAKVCKEVRSRFKTQDDITVEAANGLTYTIAVLQESMRLVPPVPAGFPRKVPSSGAEIDGYYLPGNCNASVAMTQLASYNDPVNFRNPAKFAPERWLGDPLYKDDNHATFSPFSFGPRNCVGKNLAYAEMRLITAKLIFNFDMELRRPEMDDWLKRCRVAALWSKPPLLVKLTPIN